MDTRKVSLLGRKLSLHLRNSYQKGQLQRVTDYYLTKLPLLHLQALSYAMVHGPVVWRARGGGNSWEIR